MLGVPASGGGSPSGSGPGRRWHPTGLRKDRPRSALESHAAPCRRAYATCARASASLRFLFFNGRQLSLQAGELWVESKNQVEIQVYYQLVNRSTRTHGLVSIRKNLAPD
jgi:hypothetical protein